MKLALMSVKQSFTEGRIQKYMMMKDMSIRVDNVLLSVLVLMIYSLKVFMTATLSGYSQQA